MDDPSAPTEQELQEIVLRAQEGDQGAFSQLYDRFFQSVYRYAAFRLPPELAEDVTADVFVKVWEKLHTYRAQKSVPFAAWLFRIARHAVIDAYRARRTTEEMPETLEDTDVFNRAETRMERAETLRIVRTAMDKLPRRYREVLLLTFVSELPNAEAARVLRTSEGSVRILKMRALRKLESFLPPETGNPA